jgi:hypothetical protein
MRKFYAALLATCCLFLSPARATEVDLSLGQAANSSGYTVVPNVNGTATLSWNLSGVLDGGYVQFSILALNPATLNPATNCGAGLDAGCTATVSGYITSAGPGSISLAPTTSTVLVGYTLDGGGPNQTITGLFETLTMGPSASGNKPLQAVSYASGNLPSTCANGSVVYAVDGGIDAGGLMGCSGNAWVLIKSM